MAKHVINKTKIISNKNHKHFLLHCSILFITICRVGMSNNFVVFYVEKRKKVKKENNSKVKLHFALHDRKLSGENEASVQQTKNKRDRWMKKFGTVGIIQHQAICNSHFKFKYSHQINTLFSTSVFNMASSRATSRWMSLVTSPKSSVETALSTLCDAGSIL